MNILDTTKKELYEAIVCEARKYCEDLELLDLCMRSLNIDRLLAEQDENKLRAAYNCQAKLMAYHAGMYEPDEDYYDDDTIDYPKAIAYYSIAYSLLHLLWIHFHDWETTKELANSIFDIGVPQENSAKYSKALLTYGDARSLITEQVREIYEGKDQDITSVIKQTKELLFLYDAIEKHIERVNRHLGNEV